MIYIEINNENYLIGMPWQEVAVPYSEGKKEIQKRIDSVFPAGYRYGVTAQSDTGAVVSVGRLDVKYVGVSDPNINSLGCLVAKSIVNGIFVASFSIGDLSSKIKSSLTAQVPAFIESLDESDRFYWACACQDGVVVSSGEAVGSIDQINSFIFNQSSLLNDSSVIVSELEIPLSSEIDSHNVNSIENIIFNKNKSCKITLIKGKAGVVASVSLALLVALAFAGASVYQSLEDSENERIMKLREAANNATKTPQMIEAERIELLRLNYIKDFGLTGLNSRSSLDFNDAVSLIDSNIKETPFGWNMNSANCFSSSSACIFTYNKTLPQYKLNDFLLKMKLDIDDVRFSAKGDTVSFSKPVNVSSDSFEPTESSIKDYFESLKSSLSRQVDLISRTQTLNQRVESVISQDGVVVTGTEAFNWTPSQVYNMSLILKSSEGYLLPLANKAFIDKDFLRIKQLEFNKTNDNKVAWALKYSYPSIITNN